MAGLKDRLVRALAERPTSNGQERTVDLQEVARVAYELYLQRGGEHGHDVEDWVKAEALVRRRGISARR